MVKIMKWLDFKITNRCNNKCKYCGVPQDSPLEKDKLSPNTIAKCLNSALQIGFSHFALLGGEPSLRNDFRELLTPMYMDWDNFDTLMVITNLLIYNEKMYRAIFETTAKVGQIVVSFDNFNEPNYKNQNVSLMLKRIEKIKNLAEEYDLNTRMVHIHMVISRENYKSIASFVEYFLDQGIHVSMALVEPFLIVSKQPENYNEFSHNDIKIILDELDKLESKNLLEWPNKILRKYIQEFIIMKKINLEYCSAGRNHIVIEGDGNVYPCLTNAYSRINSYGNILHTDFKNIYYKMNDFRCDLKYSQTCWDHYLWSQLEKIYRM
ncbi:MAG: radical SAM protein [Promethearchaeota archaeon]